MTQGRQQVLVVGDTHAAEMPPVVTVLDDLASGAEVRHVATLADADALVIEEAWYPDLVVVCQSWPDEFTTADVQRMLSVLPLARWICCCSAWCESDGRNRDIWPLAVRVPARRAWGRIHRELAVLRGETPPLPLTASRDEIFSFDHGPCEHVLSTDQPIYVHSPDSAYRRFVRDVLSAAGCESAIELAEIDPSAAVWDADPWTAAAAGELKSFRAQHPETAVVATMNFPHPENIAAVTACGADAVVPKLAPLGHLLDALQAALDKNPQTSC